MGTGMDTGPAITAMGTGTDLELGSDPEPDPGIGTGTTGTHRAPPLPGPPSNFRSQPPLPLAAAALIDGFHRAAPPRRPMRARQSSVRVRSGQWEPAERGGLGAGEAGSVPDVV